jgi:hypothetical protein
MNITEQQQLLHDYHEKGFAVLEEAFPRALAQACCELIWKETGCDPLDSSAWQEPVIRIAEMTQEPFVRAANTTRLLQAFDLLAGPGNWIPRQSLGSFPVRFPVEKQATDTGWHVDASFPGEDPTDYFGWRINHRSKGRALLMLFLFTDTGMNDAPTLVREGSHTDVAELLKPQGEAGISFMELAQLLDTLPERPVSAATGAAGTVYLCHPFLVHRAQDHRGTSPKIMAQPPLMRAD